MLTVPYIPSRQYIGARYIPKIVGDWDITREYEPLMVVYYNGASYTSKTYIPAGIDISNTSYWALSADYNAQIAAYRAEVLDYSGQVTDYRAEVLGYTEKIDNFNIYNVVNYATDDTDDYSEIINDLLQLDEDGLIIFIPSGTYQCKTPIVIDKPNRIIMGDSKGAKLVLTESITAFIDLSGTTANSGALKNIHLDCAHNADYGVYSSDWVSEFNFEYVKIGNANIAAFNLPVYLTRFSNCSAYNSVKGFVLPIYDSTRGTSTTLERCFSADCTIGYELYLTYSSLINCASDRNDLAYYVKNCMGVNLIGCGAEGTKKLVKCDSWWGGSIEGFFGANNGDASDTPADYLIDLSSAYNISIGGYYGSQVGNAKLLNVSGTSLGVENVTVLDYSIRKNQIGYTSNYAFKKPIKLLRADELGDDRSVSFDNAADLSNYLKNEMPSIIDYDLTINITDDLVQTSTTRFNISNVKGAGKIIFNLNNHSITTPSNEYKMFRLLNVSCNVIIKDGALINAWNNNNQQLIETVNGRLSINNIAFTNPTGLKAGSGISARNGATVIVGSDCTKSGVFGSDGVYQFMDCDELSFMDVKATF